MKVALFNSFGFVRRTLYSPLASLVRQIQPSPACKAAVLRVCVQFGAAVASVTVAAAIETALGVDGVGVRVTVPRAEPVVPERVCVQLLPEASAPVQLPEWEPVPDIAIDELAIL